VTLSPGSKTVPEFYDLDAVWSAESLKRLRIMRAKARQMAARWYRAGIIRYERSGPCERDGTKGRFGGMVLLHLASDEVPPRPIATTAGALHCPSIAALVLSADWRLEPSYLRAWFS
jgi:hypothetical protein